MHADCISCRYAALCTSTGPRQFCPPVSHCGSPDSLWLTRLNEAPHIHCTEKLCGEMPVRRLASHWPTVGLYIQFFAALAYVH